MRNISTTLGKYHSTLLPIRKFTHFALLHLTTNSKSSKILSLIFSGCTRIDVIKEFKRSLLQIQNIHKVLSEATNFKMTVWTNISECRLQFTTHQFDKGGFTSSVGAD